MYKDEAVSYVKDALIVWSVCMHSFDYIKWVLHKKKLKPSTKNDVFKDNHITSLYIDSCVESYVNLDYKPSDYYNSVNFSINETQWEHTLIKYTKKICEVYLPESSIKDRYKCYAHCHYCRYTMTVELLNKPNEMDYLSSLTRLLELNKDSSITFPSFLFLEQ